VTLGECPMRRSCDGSLFDGFKFIELDFVVLC